MENVNIRLVPRNTSDSTINLVTDSVNVTISDISEGTYDYTITSDYYDTVVGVVVVDQDKEIDISLSDTEVITWVLKTRTRDVPFQTEVTYDNDMDQGQKNITKQGVVGSEQQTYEQKHINGEGTWEERNHSAWTIVKQPVTQHETVGTRIVNLLNDSNVFSAGSNDLLTDGVKDPNKTFKVSETIHIHKWESDGRIRWFSGMVEWLKSYTIEFEIRKTSGSFNDIGGYLSGSWFDYDKTIFKDGVKITGDWETGVTLDDTTAWQTYKIHITMGELVGLQDEFTIEPNVSDGTTCKYEIRNISLFEGLN